MAKGYLGMRITTQAPTVVYLTEDGIDVAYIERGPDEKEKYDYWMTTGKLPECATRFTS